MNRIMKSATTQHVRYLFLTAVTVAVLGCAERSRISSSEILGSSVEIELINPAAVERKDELITVYVDDAGLLDPAELYVYKDGVSLPSQVVDLNFDGEADAVCFLVDLKPNEKASVTLAYLAGKGTLWTKRAHAEISVNSALDIDIGNVVKVDGGRFFSLRRTVRVEDRKEVFAYRFEGPLIETDKVGYRLYWDRRGAIDVYGKTRELSIGDNHIHGVSHHTMQPWGRDLLHNGKALGCGGLAVGRGTERFSPSGAGYAEIIIGNDGPVFASYRMIYKGLRYKDKEYNLIWDISMSAGRRYLKHLVTVTKGGELELMAGLTNHSKKPGVNKDSRIGQIDKLDWLGTFGSQCHPDTNAELAARSTELMGLALLWPHGQFSGLSSQWVSEEDSEFQVVFKPASRLTYYSLATYNGEKASAICEDKAFYQYLNELAVKFANPVVVKIK